MKNKHHFPNLFLLFSLLLVSITFMSGCGPIRYDNSESYTLGKDQGSTIHSSSKSGKKYTVGPNDGTTAKYSERNDPRSKTYISQVEGNRYTISQYDKATARYTLLKGKGRHGSVASSGSSSMDGTMNGSGGRTDDARSIQPVEGMKMVLDITDVLFDFDKAVIKHKFYPELDKWVEFFLKNTQVQAEIQGHADSTGPTDYNQRLSERRARAVIAYLVDKGVDANQLTATGYGETLPVAPNTTKDGRQKNRRVELNY